MIKHYIPQNEWIELDENTRNKLVLALTIKKSVGERRVVNNKLVQDGISEQDLKTATNIGNLLLFLGEEDSKTFLKVPLSKLLDFLWGDIIKKINNEKVATKKTNKSDSKKPLQHTNGRGYNKVR